MKIPEDQTFIRSAVAKVGPSGIQNLILKDDEGNVVCQYDPKKYGSEGGKEISIETND